MQRGFERFGSVPTTMQKMVTLLTISFSLIMRMYLPDLDKLKTWEYPEITVVK